MNGEDWRRDENPIQKIKTTSLLFQYLKFRIQFTTLINVHEFPYNEWS